MKKFDDGDQTKAQRQKRDDEQKGASAIVTQVEVLKHESKI